MMVVNLCELKKEETIHNPFTYFGQTYDEKTGLYYLRARYYDPTTGRFTQQDPAEDGYNWYVYGNNNSIMYADASGNAGTEVAFMLLSHAFFGNGENKDYSFSKEFQMTIQSSPILKNEIQKQFNSFKNSGKTYSKVSGSIGFYGNDWNTNDFDLHLAVGKANYTMQFTKETKQKSFLWKKWTETSYTVTVTISDTYDFDEYREAASISNWLNNWGYDQQKKGNIKPYFWSIQFTRGL